MENPNHTRALRIALIYVIFTAIWIIFSDRLLALVVQDFEQHTRVQTLKGLFFITFTAGLIYVLLRRELRHQDQVLTIVQAIIEASPLAIIYLDADGTVRLWNAAAERIFGWSRAETIGRMLPFVPPEKVPEFEALRTRVMQGESLHSVEAQRRRKDGQEITISISTAPMRDTQGRIIGIMAALDDITARKAAEEEIQTLNAELEQRVAERTAQFQATNQELEAFAYSVSHDLRAPLRAIDGYSRIIEEDHATNLDAEGTRLLGLVRANTQAMDWLITNLLALSRTACVDLKLSRIDMTTLAHSIYHEVTTPDVRQTFTFSVTPLPDAYADPTLMRQVWHNLISNAIKYTMPKDERRITVSGWDDGDRTVYCIKDTGVGFDPRYIHRLFDVFQRLHSVLDFEGSGVGLAIVQRIIHRLGGEVWAEGQPDEGAAFYFALKRRSAADPEGR